MRDFERDLKQLIDGLSDSVDCFDKIARRAYIKETVRSANNAYTVSGVDNVSERRKFRFFPAVAVSLAVCLCVSFFLPISLFHRPGNNVTEDPKHENEQYQALKAELYSELNSTWFVYEYKDCLIDEFNADSLFINPLCVYKIPESDATHVRVYTKTIEYGGKKYPTNQVYLVTYYRNFTDDNIVAIIDSGAKITEEELAPFREQLPSQPTAEWNAQINTNYCTTLDGETANSNSGSVKWQEERFKSLITNTFTVFSDGRFGYIKKPASIASFAYASIFKAGDSVVCLSSDVLYWNIREYKNNENLFSNASYNIAHNFYIQSYAIQGDVSYPFVTLEYESNWNTPAFNEKFVKDSESEYIPAPNIYSYKSDTDSPYFTRSTVENGKLTVTDISIDLLGNITKDMLNNEMYMTNLENAVSKEYTVISTKDGEVVIFIKAPGRDFNIYLPAGNNENFGIQNRAEVTARGQTDASFNGEGSYSVVFLEMNS